MPSRSDRRSRTTGYDRNLLLSEYGDVYERVRTLAVDRSKYEAMVAAREDDAIGGARVLVHREEDALLVSNRGEDGWDVPGGAREVGEAPEETARREVREEVGLRVALRGLIQVNEFGFVPEDGDEERVSGLWVIFEGVPTGDGRDVTVQESELDGAKWFDAPPEDPDPAAQYAIEGFFDGD